MFIGSPCISIAYARKSITIHGLPWDLFEFHKFFADKHELMYIDDDLSLLNCCLLHFETYAGDNLGRARSRTAVSYWVVLDRELRLFVDRLNKLSGLNFQGNFGALRSNKDSCKISTNCTWLNLFLSGCCVDPGQVAKRARKREV